MCWFESSYGYCCIMEFDHECNWCYNSNHYRFVGYRQRHLWMRSTHETIWGGSKGSFTDKMNRITNINAEPAKYNDGGKAGNGIKMTIGNNKGEVEILMTDRQLRDLVNLFQSILELS